MMNDNEMDPKLDECGNDTFEEYAQMNDDDE